MSTSSGSCEIEKSSDEQPDDDDDDFMVVYMALELMGSSKGAKKKVVLPNIPRMSGIQWVEITLVDLEECYNMYRMTRSVFHRLHDTLVQNYGLTPSRGICTKEALAMFLWKCGAPQSVRQLKNRFTHSLETVSRKFNEVLDSICRFAVAILRPKDAQFGSIHPRLEQDKFWPHFNDCIGAIDGTHIPVTVSKSQRPKYIGRHGYASQNVMAVCDFDMRFTFVVTGWPGSAHDTRVFLDTLVTYKNKFPHPPEGKYYLVDSGPNRKGYLAPFKGQRYHVTEWENGPVGMKEVFNYHHASLRNVIERSFGVLKMKWRILLQVPSFSPRKQSKIIVACMALHNFIRDTDRNDEHFVTYVDDHSEGSEGPTDSLTPDDTDMCAFRDALAFALIS
ncbi:unnamed protein product [Urochloa humidicola]